MEKEARGEAKMSAEQMLQRFVTLILPCVLGYGVLSILMFFYYYKMKKR